MPTLYSLTETQLRAAVRTDLSDTGATRWSDPALDRAIARALDRITAVYPHLTTTVVPTIRNVGRYPLPPGARGVERIEYPIGRAPRRFVPFETYRTPAVPDPTVAPALSPSGSGSLGAGVYAYAYTFSTPGGGETLPSPAASLSAVAGMAVAASGIPLPPEGVTALTLYRTAAGGGTLKRLATFAGAPADLAGTYTDTAPDSALGPAAPAVNTTEGTDALLLVLPPAGLPDGSRPMAVETATDHQLDAGGTTLPERLWDALALGAQYHAVDAYLTNVLDNFQFADGMLRDRVDDTKSMESWTAYAALLGERFVARLESIKREYNARRSGIVQWGEVPRWGERL